MSKMRWLVDLVDDHTDEKLIVDLEGGTDEERQDMLLRLGEWVMRNGRSLGVFSYRMISCEHSLDFSGATLSITAQYCSECAGRRIAEWLKSQGLEARGLEVAA